MAVGFVRYRGHNAERGYCGIRCYRYLMDLVAGMARLGCLPQPSGKDRAEARSVFTLKVRFL